ncbi:MAG TPA: phosphoribosyltransferase family protein [Gaiellaceae bacterium]
MGAVHLTRTEIAARVVELGNEIATEYDGLDPLLIAPLKSSVVFLADLTRALRIPHTLDVIELAPYTGGQEGGVRLLKDVDTPLEGRHVVLVEDVVDTGLTLHFLCRTLLLRNPASLAAVTLLDRPYRRLVDQLPVRFIGFTVPDELFAGYGLGLDERWRALPDLHVVSSVALSRTAIEAA